MTLNAQLASELQKLSPSAKVEFYILDLTALGDVAYYIHAGTNELTQPVTWQGVEYTPMPIVATGFDFNTSGQLPRPKMTFANTSGAITAFILQFNDCLGAKVTRKRTLVKFLDAVNFDGGVNPSADDTASYPDDIFYIKRKVKEDKVSVEFELGSATDVVGVKLPRRQIIQNLCQWKYRGNECGYAGTNYFKSDDSVTANSSQDVCGKRLSSCKLRFGATSQLPFGSFPGASNGA